LLRLSHGLLEGFPTPLHRSVYIYIYIYIYMYKRQEKKK